MVTAHRPTGRAARVGFFGILGSGNLGNDGSLDAMVAAVRSRIPDVEIDVMCMGPEHVRARHGGTATPLQWSSTDSATWLPHAPRRLLGRVLDLLRTARWVRRHDVVVVPGMGVLETTLPQRAWGFPLALLGLTAAGRLTGTPVALVSVGANVTANPATRRVLAAAARLARYRSYRDELSRDAMRTTGVDVSADPVYPDLVFALPAPDPAPEPGAVGVGVMDYHGGDEDRARARELHRSYVAAVTGFVGHLVDAGRPVRLFTGDPADRRVVEEVLAGLRATRPALDPLAVVAEQASTLDELTAAMARVETVVATRYHNVLTALRLSRPTLSIGYAQKNDVLMADMGLGAYCQHAAAVDGPRLLRQFTELESRRDELAPVLRERNAEHAARLEEQFDALLAAVALPLPGPATTGSAR